MQARFRSQLRDLLDSLWFTPTLIALAYVALALVLLRADATLGLDTQGLDAWAVGGADGARGVLFAIAGTSLSVLSVIFTLTVVVLQIASAQFTPRVMRNPTGDWGTQLVLGVFFGTFTYALLVLRAVRYPGEEDGGPGFVPVAAVAVAIVLALVSIAFMIYYINHVARSVQVAVIIQRVTTETQELLEEPLSGESAVHRHPNGPLLAPPDDGVVVVATGDGYLQAIDAGTLLRAAQSPPVTIHTKALVGDFLLDAAPLATVWPSDLLTRKQVEAIQTAFVLGPERTRQQDAALGIRQLADIAVRGLSPAINDPTTATLCIDRLGQLLVQASRQEDTELLVGAAGGHVLLRRPDFAQLCGVAFTQIRHFGAGDAIVAVHIMRTLGEVAARVPAGRQEPLRQQATALLTEARHSLVVADDLHRLERAASWVHEEISTR